MPEISRISSHRHVPKPIKRARQVKQIQTASIKRKIENIRRHSKPDTLPKRADERSKKVIALEK